MIELRYGERYFKENGKWYKQIVKEVTNTRDIKTLENLMKQNGETEELEITELFKGE